MSRGGRSTWRGTEPSRLHAAADHAELRSPSRAPRLGFIQAEESVRQQCFLPRLFSAIPSRRRAGRQESQRLPRSERSSPGFSCALTGTVRTGAPPSHGASADTLPRCFFLFFGLFSLHDPVENETARRGGGGRRALTGPTGGRRIPAFPSVLLRSSRRGDAPHKSCRAAAEPWKLPPRSQRGRSGAELAAGGETLPADGTPGSGRPIAECSLLSIVRR